MDDRPHTPISRPHSRAASDTSFVTAVPDSSSPRSLTREIDHIKTLVSRSQGVPRPTDNSISAQVFRRRSHSHEPITHNHILHELDSLKKRLKHEDAQGRRPSNVDPDSESEPEDVLDERDEEIQWYRDELDRVKQQREEWIEHAENRIDSLLEDKETLSRLAEESREELERVKASLTERGRRIWELEEHSRKEAEAAENLASEHSLREDESRKQFDEIRRLNDQLQADLKVSRSTVESLEDAVKYHRIQEQKSTEQNDELRTTLSKALKDVEAHTALKQRVTKDFASLTSQIEALTDERDEHRSRLGIIVRENDAQNQKSQDEILDLRERLERAEKTHEDEIVDSKAAADGLSKQLQESIRRIGELEQSLKAKEDSFARTLEENSHELASRKDQVSQLNEQLRARSAEYEKALESMRSDHESTLDGMKASHGTEIENIRRDADTRLEHAHAAFMKSSDEARDLADVTSARHDATLRTMKEEHQSILEGLRATHAGEIEDVRRDADARLEQTTHDSKRHFDETVSAHNASIEELQKEFATRHEELVKSTEPADAFHKAEVQRFQKEVTELQSQVKTLSDEHQAALSAIGEEHKSIVADLTAKQQRDRDKVQADTLQQLASLQEKHHADMTALVAERDRHAADLEISHNQALSEAEDRSQALRASHETVLQELRREHSQELEYLREAHRESLTTSKADASQEIARSQVTHDTALQTLRREHLQEVDRLQDAHTKALAASEASTTQATARLQSSHDRALAELEAGWSSKSEAAAALHEADLQRAATDASAQAGRARDDFEEQLRQRDADADARLAGARKDAAKELGKIQEEHRASVEAADRIMEEKEAELVKAREELAARLDVVKKEHEEHIRFSNAEHANSIARLEADHASDTKKAQWTHEQAQKSHDEQVRSLRTEHATDVAKLQADYAAGRETAEHAHKEVITKLKASNSELEQQHRLLVVEHQEVVERNAAGLVEASDVHKKAITDLEQQLQNVKAVHEANITRLKREHEEQLHEQLTTLNADHERDTTRSREEQATQLDEQLSQVKSEHEKMIEHLRDEYATQAAKQRRELSTVHEASMADLRSEHDARVTELRRTNDRSQAGSQREHDEAVAAARAEVQVLQSREAKASDAHKLAIGALEERLEQLEASHQSAMKGLRQDHEAQLNDQKRTIDITHEELLRKHGEAIAAAEAAAREAEFRQVKASDEHKQTIVNLEAQLEKAKTDRESALLRLREHNEEQLTDARREAEQSQANLERKHAEEIAKANAENQESLSRATEDYNDSKRKLEKRLQDAEHAAAAKYSDLDTRHKKLLSEKDAEMENAQQQHEMKLAEVRQSHTDEMNALRLKHDQHASNLEFSAQAQLDKAKREHTLASAERDAELAAKVSEMRYQHSKVLSDTQTEHQEAQDKVLDELRQTHQAEVTTLQQSHEQKLSQARSEGLREAEARMSRLRQEHETDLAAALADANEASTNRLRAQAQAHGHELEGLHESLNLELTNLQSQLEEASELRRSQMQASDAQNQGALEELGGKLSTAELASADLASKHITLMAELKELQARLDIELTGRAEAERSLAEIKKQRFEEERMTTESKESLREQLAVLQIEHEAVMKQLEASQSVVSHTQSGSADRAIDGQNGADADDAIDLRQRLAIAEHDRMQAHTLAEQRAVENSELTRQNASLVNELQSAMERLSVSKRSSPDHVDAAAQNDRPMSSPDKHKSTRPKRQVLESQESGTWQSGSFEDYLKEAQAELSELGTVISANEALFAQKIQEHVGGLQRAKDQLAASYKAKFDALLADREQRERDVSAKNAEEFAQKRQELVDRYVTRADKPTARSTLVRELPTQDQKALRNAEEKLVLEYENRVAKRRSQIALNHAAEFQTLTQDYDRQIADLLRDREKLEGDLSIDPIKFELDLGEFNLQSGRLEAEKHTSIQSTPASPLLQRASEEAGETSPVTSVPRPASKEVVPTSPLSMNSASPSTPTSTGAAKSGLPKRILASVPRISTSTPKAVPYPGNRDSPDATSQPLRRRTPGDTFRSVSEKHAFNPQRSLLRGKYPVGDSTHQRSATNPDVSAAAGASVAHQDNAGASTDLGAAGVELSSQRSARQSRWRSLRQSNGTNAANRQAPTET